MSRISTNQALLALDALGVATMGPELTAEAMPSRPRRRRPVTEPGSYYVSGRWLLDWVLDENHPDSRFADLHGCTFGASPNGRFVVMQRQRLVHQGRAKNHSLNNAMNAAEKWWVANKDSLLAPSPLLSQKGEGAGGEGNSEDPQP